MTLFTLLMIRLRITDSHDPRSWPAASAIVGDHDWGISVWVNHVYHVCQAAKGTFEVFDDAAGEVGVEPPEPPGTQQFVSAEKGLMSVKFEIEAQDILLDIAGRKGWTQAEIDLITRNRIAWLERFESMTKALRNGQ